MGGGPRSLNDNFISIPASDAIPTTDAIPATDVIPGEFLYRLLPFKFRSTLFRVIQSIFQRTRELFSRKMAFRPAPLFRWLSQPCQAATSVETATSDGGIHDSGKPGEPDPCSSSRFEFRQDN
ncbi:hypothetical protein L1987_68605 [Smallanthus sonchifolius]|uniref:Uncharacterized protein n=1 Tax=Smallanthus sonchifolius TaxID=185202 RepID=A0ACB9B5H9_9ASTR|nr:hypothetical protein L1987_68605 [Smallanthus sonchifolius]